MPHDDADTSTSRSPQSRNFLRLMRQRLSRSVLRWVRRNEKEKVLTDAVTALIEQPDDKVGEVTQEKALLVNIVALSQRTIADCMCPRADIIGVEVGISLGELVHIFSHEGHSRMPIYRKELDDVIGMVHIKDVMACIAEGRNCSVESLLRPAPFVPPTKPILDLLMEMRQSRQHLAIVVDEFGGVDGLVTIEDLVEQIVGDINDEHDDTLAPSFTMRADGSWLVDARMPLAAFSARIPLALNTEEMREIETLGGLVLSLANRIPKRGEIFTHASGYEFEIIDSDRRRIKRIRVRRPKEEQQSLAAERNSETSRAENEMSTQSPSPRTSAAG